MHSLQNSKPTIAMVYTTMASLDTAKALARTAVEQQYAACVNIVPGAHSIYHWEGRLEEATECLVFFKTSVEKVEALIRWLSEQHPYAVPALLSGSLKSSKSYAEFVQKWVGGGV